MPIGEIEALTASRVTRLTQGEAWKQHCAQESARQKMLFEAVRSINRTTADAASVIARTVARCR